MPQHQPDGWADLDRLADASTRGILQRLDQEESEEGLPPRLRAVRCGGEVWPYEHPDAGRRPHLVLTQRVRSLQSERTSEVCAALGAATDCPGPG